MAEHKGPLDRLLDLVVYVPVGIATGYRDLIPTLAQKGRAHLDSQVRVARMVGQFAVAKSEHEAQKVINRWRDGGGGTPSSEGANGDAASDRDSVVPPAAEPPPGAVVDVSIGPEDLPDGETLAIPSYDTLAASQVISRLVGLNAVELEEVRRYEASHRARRTVLAKIAQLQAR
jgi:hypothetical protein